MAREGEEETADKEEEEEEGNKERAKDRETARGAPAEVTCLGGDATPPEENADLPGFTQ